MNRKVAIFPGTFEFFHEGHLDILKKGLNLFELIYIVVGNNFDKDSSSLDIRYQKILENKFIKKNQRIKVIKNSGLTVNVLKKLKCNYIIRGIRNHNDIQYEIKLHDAYKLKSKKFEVIYFLSEKNKRDISSSKIKKELKNEK